MIEHTERITRDLAICGGEPVVAGTRVTIRTILASLAEGDSVDDILADFPSLTKDDVWAVIVCRGFYGRGFAGRRCSERLMRVELDRYR